MNCIFAAIDLGSNAIKLKIVQVIQEKYQILEDLSVPMPLGDEVFEMKSVQIETIKETVETLIYFQNIMQSYGATAYKAVATSALREAENSKTVIEIIRMRTGFEIEVIEDSIEKFLTYKAFRDYMPNFRDIRKSALIIEINSGSFDISHYHHNKLIRNDEVKIGIKALKHMLFELENKTINYPVVLKEFLETKIAYVASTKEFKKTKYFLALGSEIKRIREILFKNQESIEYAEFKSVCHDALYNAFDLRKVVETAQMDWYEFLSAIIIYDIFTDYIITDKIMIPTISLRDGILAELIENAYHMSRYQAFNQDIFTLAYEMNKKHRGHEVHIKYLERNALKIMNALKNGYTFHHRDEVILRLSAILHEIDTLSKVRNYNASSLKIFGVTQTEANLIEQICKRFTHEDHKSYLDNPYAHSAELQSFSMEDQVRIYKLSSILALVDALDIRKNQIVSIKDIEIDEDNLTIYVKRMEETSFEEWWFEINRDYFSNTYGIVPELKDID